MNSTLFPKCVDVVNALYDNGRTFSYGLVRILHIVDNSIAMLPIKKKQVKLLEISQSTPRGGRDHCAPKKKSHHDVWTAV